MKWTAGRLSEPTDQEQTIHEILGLEKGSQPIFLYLESSQSKQGASTKKITGTVLKDERVNIGARFFTTIKMPWANADERLTKLVGRRDIPTLAIFQSDGKKVGALQSRHSPSKVYGMMKRAVKGDYKGVSLDKTIKAEQKILNDIDKLDTARKTLANAEKKKNLAPAKQRDIQKRREELAKKKKELDEREAAIWKAALEKLKS